MYIATSTNVGTSGGYPVYDDRDTFYTALAAFTADEDNVRFVSDIVYNDDGLIEASAVGPRGCVRQRGKVSAKRNVTIRVAPRVSEAPFFARGAVSLTLTLTPAKTCTTPSWPRVITKMY